MNRLPENWAAHFAEARRTHAAADRLRRLDTHRRSGLHIVRNGRPLLNLAGNDYLGLCGEEGLFARFLAETPAEMLLPGATASQLLGGRSMAHEALEDNLKTLYRAPAALGFTSGYQMNLGIISALADRHTLILADKLIHASMVDGILLSGARWHRFRHNDTAHLAELLDRHHSRYPRILIVTESLFSMDGDCADLPALVRLKNSYPNTALYVDEAHAFGVRGRNGAGLAEESGTLHDIDFLAGTLGKAAASVGGYLICRPEVRDYLANRMRPLIFSTALPPVNAAWSAYIVEKMPEFAGRRRRLAAHAERLRGHLQHHYGTAACPSASHIVPLITGSNASALQLAAKLEGYGFYTAAVRPPTVPPDRARIRISLNAAIDGGDIDRLADTLLP